MKTTLFLSALCLAGCGRIAPDQSIINTAKSAVSAQLKDPSSAEFRDVTVVGSYCVEGAVNAKNSFGGYVGFKQFKFDSKRKKTMIDPGMDEPVDLDNWNEQQMQLRQDFLAMTLKCVEHEG